MATFPPDQIQISPDVHYSMSVKLIKLQTGVRFEDQQDLLGHRSGRITTHYSIAELQNLITAANRVCEERNGITLTVLKLVGSIQVPTKPPQLVEAKIN